MTREYRHVIINLRIGRISLGMRISLLSSAGGFSIATKTVFGCNGKDCLVFYMFINIDNGTLLSYNIKEKTYEILYRKENSRIVSVYPIPNAFLPSLQRKGYPADDKMKVEKNADYLTMLDKSMAEAEAGGFIINTISDHEIDAENITNIKEILDNEYENLGTFKTLFKTFIISIQINEDVDNECYEVIVFPELDTTMFRNKKSLDLISSIINKHIVATFSMYDSELNYCRNKAFEDAKAFGKNLYYALKNEYKVKRVLGSDLY